MLLPTDQIKGLPRGNVAEFTAYAARNGAVGPYREWIEAADVLCRDMSIDNVLVFFQAEVNTKCFQSEEWLAGNTTGLEIVTDRLIQDGEMAAVLHVCTLYMRLGHQLFPASAAAMRKNFRNWVGFTLDSMRRDHKRPPLARVEDLARKYLWQPNVLRYLWSGDSTYANRICARAMLSRLRIPSQTFFHKTQPFAEPKIIRSTLNVPILEGPSYSANRVISWLEAGSQFVAVGETVGHAPLGNNKWYVLESPTYGYVHTKGMREV